MEHSGWIIAMSCESHGVIEHRQLDNFEQLVQTNNKKIYGIFVRVKTDHALWELCEDQRMPLTKGQ